MFLGFYTGPSGFKNTIANSIFWIFAVFWKFSFFFLVNFNFCSMRCRAIVLLLGRRNGFQSGGAMKHWKLFSATMVNRQEKILNSSRSKLTKTVTFYLGDSILIVSAFKFFLFFLCFLFSFCYAKKWGRRGHTPPAPRCCQSCLS